MPKFQKLAALFNSISMMCFLSQGLRRKIVSPFCYFFIFLVSTAHAQSDLIFKAQNLELAKDTFWLEMIRYETKAFSFFRFESAIRSKKFFLSAEGDKNAEAELRSTLEGFLSPARIEAIDEHAICRFPARYRWLKMKLDWQGRDDILAQCRAYRKWNKNGQIKSISLFFATGYFGNPASFFGHSLLRFNTEISNVGLLDTAVNYGAMTPPHENAVLYMLKGLMGGYEAAFTDREFYFHNHSYGEEELRDLWEYRLNLTPDEVQFIVDHTWELLSQRFTYAFLSDNCAYRMAELLEMVFKTPVMSHNPLYTMPVSVFENLGTKKRPDGRPLVNSVKRFPSRQTRMADKYLALSRADQKIVKKVIKDQNILSSALYADLDLQKKSVILESLIDYFSFRLAKSPEDIDLKKRRQDLLLQRFKLPPSPPSALVDEPAWLAPHQSQNSFMVRAAYSTNQALGSMTEFTIRPALYDLLSPTVARPNNSSLEVAKTTVRIQNNSYELKELDFFAVSNFHVSKTDLPGDEGLTWKLKLGIYPQKLDCRHCQVFGIDGGFGSTFELGQGFNLYGMIGGQAQNEREKFGTVAVNPELGFLFEVSRSWKLHLNYTYQRFLNGQNSARGIIFMENRFGFSRNWDLRLVFQQVETQETRFSFARYF